MAAVVRPCRAARGRHPPVRESGAPRAVGAGGRHPRPGGRQSRGVHMEERACADERVESSSVAAPDVALTANDRERLTFFKWRYVLQADGFAVPQARRLTLMRW